MVKKTTTTKPAEKKVGITASVIEVIDPKAKIKSRPGSSRHKRLTILMNSNGKTIREFYAKCNKEVPTGSVSKKLIVVAVKMGLIANPGLSDEDLGRYNYKRKKAPLKLAA